MTADLTDPGWTDGLPRRTYDAVLTATALHWLDTEPLRTLYGHLAGLLREGGVFLNADHMVDESAPRINAAARAHTEARKERERGDGAQDWAAWWRAVADDPGLAEPARRRFALLGDPRTPADAPARRPRPTTVEWHTRTLRDAGLREARPVWCSPSDAVVAALR